MRTPDQSIAAGRDVCESASSANTTESGRSAKLASIHDPPSRGTWNMALDEALLHRAITCGQPTLRFYGWDQPTLSLGYFQRYADRASHPASLDCAVVRRTTGGGAILHDRELTYSCTLPASHVLSRRSADLYYAIHESIVAVLGRSGLIARLHCCDDDHRAAAAVGSMDDIGCGAKELVEETKAPPAAREPFLCFQRRTAGDIILEGYKVAGSAQRRCRGAVLQHGSILLARSRYAPELPGICDLGGSPLDPLDLAERMRVLLSARLKLEMAFEVPTPETLDQAADIETSKFAAECWQRLR